MVKDQKLYYEWGYDSFAEYAKQELGIGANKAQALVQAANFIANKQLDETLLNRLSWIKFVSLM